MSNGSIESIGGQTEPWQDSFTEKQALDFASSSEPVKFKSRPIIIAVTILSSIYLILFIVGMAVAFGKSVSDVKEAIEFNKIVNEAIIKCKCIVSDEEWPDCSKNFCTLPEDSEKTINRSRILLHGNSTLCKKWISEDQQLSCFFESSQIQALNWTEWSPPNADKVKYRIKKVVPYSIYYIPSLNSMYESTTG